MTRIDDAVLDLVANAPRVTSVDALRARIRRRRRRRGGAITAVVAIVAVASVGVAASLGRRTAGPQIAVSPTTSSTAVVDKTWCVKWTRSQALAQGLSYGRVIIADAQLQAKLVSRAELSVRGNPLADIADNVGRISHHATFWVVELLPKGPGAGPYTWGIVALDANTGEVVAANEGPNIGPGSGPESTAVVPPYFAQLPDHSSECPSDS